MRACSHAYTASARPRKRVQVGFDMHQPGEAIMRAAASRAMVRAWSDTGVLPMYTSNTAAANLGLLTVISSLPSAAAVTYMGPPTFVDIVRQACDQVKLVIKSKIPFDCEKL